MRTYKTNTFRPLFVAVLAASLFAGNTLYGQRSFVQRDIITVEGIKTNIQVHALDRTQRISTRTYLDGLGRPVQKVVKAASPLGKDIVQPIAYDAHGRNAVSYLPYRANSSTGAFHAQALTEQSQFYSSSGPANVAKDSKPYSSRLFENSPLGRLLEAGNYGDAHQPGQHSATQSYRGNTAADAVRRWNTNGAPAALYAAGMLRVSDTQGADGQRVQMFTDRGGQTVLRRVYLNEVVEGSNETWLDTYYVYDDLGNLRYIVPPKASIAMRKSGNWVLTQSAVIDQIYSYQYNNKGLLVEKREPAAGAVYYIYDPLDRLVLVQDARLRTSHKWHYIKYGPRNTAISQGLYTNTQYTGRTAMQNYVQGLNYSANRYERRANSAATGYYTNLVFPTTSIEPLAYVYYNDYDLNRDGTANYAYQPQGLAGEQAASPFIRGVLTMKRERSIGNGLSNSWLTAVYFYDREGRAIQVRSNNQLNAGLGDSETQVHDFTGKVIRKKSVKKTAASGTFATLAVENEYGYDPMGRLQHIDQRHNGGSYFRLADYSYNALGQLVDKKLHSSNGGSSYLQSVDYRYDIRGRLLSINSSNLGTGGQNDDTNDLFGMELLYDKADAGLGNTASYSGRVSAVKWRSITPVDNNPREKAYKIAYDPLGRMKSALYRDRSGSTSWGNVGAFDEKNLRYDANGNLLGLQRNALVGGTVTSIDNLSYTYTGDRLNNVSDAGTGSHSGYGFRNLTGSPAGYTYDADGGLVNDPKKGLSLQYNVLGFTSKTTVTTVSGRYVDYTYVGGAMVRARYYDGGTVIKTLDYIGGYVYDNGTLSYFAMAEGRVRNTGGALKPEYILTDHQGNARVSFEEQNGTAVVRQENSYYPFGLRFPGTAVPTDANRHLYNGGSEWENAFGNLPDLYRTGHRMYDPALGRFLSPDPMAGGSAGWGTYHYAHNSPLQYNDPLGLRTQVSGPYASFWNNVLSYTEKNGAFFQSTASGEWDIYEYSSDEEAFYFAASHINDQGLWGTGAVTAGSYDAAATTFNGSVHTGGPATMVLLKSVAIVSGNKASYAAAARNIQAQVNAYWGRRNGRMTDFSNSNIALTVGGAVYGAMEGATAGDGYWLGKNGKYYTNMTGRGPNQYTGSRTGALKAAKTYRIAGKATIAGSVLLGGYMTYEGYVADGGQFGYNAQMAAASSTGSIVGGWAGAEAGALIGAGIGVWFGVVGAIPGAVIGGFVGGIAGSIGGGYAGESAVNYYYGR